MLAQHLIQAEIVEYVDYKPGAGGHRLRRSCTSAREAFGQEQFVAGDLFCRIENRLARNEYLFAGLGFGGAGFVFDEVRSWRFQRYPLYFLSSADGVGSEAVRLIAATIRFILGHSGN